MNLVRSFAFTRWFVLILLSTVILDASAAPPITRDAAVALAQKFVAENGYADLPIGETKAQLDLESIE